ncbi:MAG TPA: aminodeoxychorismate/anthranilate synthase component II [Candidatus Methylacidiphilales bacterium]|jgi:anthranilate synthase/aminodeoxychorismate synthase-like glutamine amidotransferase|nr:aminodeoxychorismate/anthranilate synthase component II [Candidatus Methylacidiphilales bacterium]
MLLIIDNYDSFTYNLVQYFGELGAEPVVKRNDEIGIAEIEALQPEAVVISPGPCTPREAGISNDVILQIGPRLPILGVCLGHQCIGHVYGGAVVRAGRLMHGKTSPILHDGTGVFADLPSPFEATRYHSLIIDPPTVPDVLLVNARTAEGEIMGVRHKEFPIHGVQFHPESILTRHGKDLLKNFLRITSDFHAKKKTA